MNERIRELAEQCYQIEDPHGQFPREVFNQEKFAELIVRECVDIVDDEGCGEGGSVRAMEKIKQHFGVE